MGRLHLRPGITGALGTGLAAAFIGLFIQSSVAASFSTIRTMEPFFFLLGVAVAASALIARGQTANSRTMVKARRMAIWRAARRAAQ